MPPLVGDTRHYKGIGECFDTGRRGSPFRLAFPDGSSLCAEFKLLELSIDTERIMLLSIKE